MVSPNPQPARPDRANKTVFTTHDVAQMCSVNINTVKSWVDGGRLLAYRTPGGHRRIRRADLLAFLVKHEMPLPPELQPQGGDRILVVDDEEDITEFVRTILDEMPEHPEVAIAMNGFEAGQLVAVFQPTVVLLDLYMPGMDGFAVCERIKSTPETADVHVIAMTGYGTEENIERIVSCGAERVLKKPFRRADLEEAVRPALRKSSPSTL